MEIGSDEGDGLAIGRNGGRSDVVPHFDHRIERRLDVETYHSLGGRRTVSLKNQPDSLSGSDQGEQNRQDANCARAGNRRPLDDLLLPYQLKLAPHVTSALPAESGMFRQ